MRVAIIGLGFVGLSLASVLASKGVSVKEKLSSISKGISPIFEPKLEKTLKSALKNSLVFSDNIEYSLKNSTLIFVTVGTPLTKSGKIDLSMIKDVSKKIGKALKNISSFKVVIIKSTVIPGTTQRLHEEFPGLRIACSPEFLRSKTSDEDFQGQEVLVVGTHHTELAEEIFEHHREAGVFSGKAAFHVSPTQAELVKYAKNSFFAMKVIFGNQFQDYCESLGEDWGVVKEIITSPQNQTIGPSHLNQIASGERGFGGDCLPKDVLALVNELENKGLDYELLRAVLNDNRRLQDQN